MVNGNSSISMEVSPRKKKTGNHPHDHNGDNWESFESFNKSFTSSEGSMMSVIVKPRIEKIDNTDSSWFSEAESDFSSSDFEQRIRGRGNKNHGVKQSLTTLNSRNSRNKRSSNEQHNKEHNKTMVSESSGFLCEFETSDHECSSSSVAKTRKKKSRKSKKPHRNKSNINDAFNNSGSSTQSYKTNNFFSESESEYNNNYHYNNDTPEREETQEARAERRRERRNARSKARAEMAWEESSSESSSSDEYEQSPAASQMKIKRKKKKSRFLLGDMHNSSGGSGIEDCLQMLETGAKNGGKSRKSKTSTSEVASEEKERNGRRRRGNLSLENKSTLR